jgi:hypothetical protein
LGPESVPDTQDGQVDASPNASPDNTDEHGNKINMPDGALPDIQTLPATAEKTVTTTTSSPVNV